MHIENILIEHWPRLRCANFFILFTEHFSESSNIRVCLKENTIDIYSQNTNSIVIDLSHIGLQIQVNSLSLLMVKNNLISFRANTSNDDNFYKEILDTPKLPEIQKSLVKLPINIKPNEKFQIICVNCKCPLTETLNFRRVLELPSENMDLSEWYCHKPMTAAEGGGDDHSCATASHSHNIDNHSNASHDESTKYNYTKFNPQQDDFLYGNFFALFHIDNFKNLHIDDDNKMLHCQRCLQHIGESLRFQSIRIWNCSVRIVMQSNNDNCQTVSRSSSPLFTGNSTYANFMFILNKILVDFELVVAMAHQTQRIIFETIHVNGTNRFLFFQIMSKNQEIYQMADTRDTVIQMKPTNGMKILFRCESNENQALLRFWQNDVNVINSQLSLEMFDCVLQRLQERSKFVPEMFRENNGFTLSYIFNDDE